MQTHWHRQLIQDCRDVFLGGFHSCDLAEVLHLTHLTLAIAVASSN